MFKTAGLKRYAKPNRRLATIVPKDVGFDRSWLAPETFSRVGGDGKEARPNAGNIFT